MQVDQFLIPALFLLGKPLFESVYPTPDFSMLLLACIKWMRGGADINANNGIGIAIAPLHHFIGSTSGSGQKLVVCRSIIEDENLRA